MNVDCSSFSRLVKLSLMASSNSTSSFTAVNDEFAHLDLNGKIIVKAQYNEDIRRIPILNDEITYDELILMMQRLFKLQPTDEVNLKYRDEDNDYISIVDDNDVSFAIQCSRILKLKLTVNENATVPLSNEIKQIRGELIEIRNRCNKLLDKFGSNSGGGGGSTGATGNGSIDSNDSSEAMTQTDERKEAKKTYGEAPRELDPLHSSFVKDQSPAKLNDSGDQHERESRKSDSQSLPSMDEKSSISSGNQIRCKM